MRPVLVRAARPADAGAWERMRQELWPASPEEHAREIADFFAGGGAPAQVLLAVREGEIVGFAEGCRELASDTEIENEASAAAHRALGFQQVDRVVCFRKDL